MRLNDLPYIPRNHNGQLVKILCDTRASCNYTTLENFPEAIEYVSKRVIMKTINKREQMNIYVRVNLLHEQHMFFVVQSLCKWDMILDMIDFDFKKNKCNN